MKVRTITLLFVLLTVTNAGSGAWCDEDTSKKDAPQKTVKITISPETTWITEPLLPDGRVDYYGALHRMLSEGVTKDNNMAPGIFSIVPGERETSLFLYRQEDEPAVWANVQEYRLRYWQHLGFDAPPDWETLQFASPRAKKGEELEYLLKYYTPDEIIARLYEHQRPKDDVDPLEFLQEAQKNEHWLLLEAIYRDWYDANNRLWTEKDFPLLAAWLPQTDDMEWQLIEISKRPRFYNPIIATSGDEPDQFLYSTLLPYVQATREVARFMLVRGNWHFTHGDYDKALECAFASQRLGQAIRTNNAFIVEDLVGVAICGMAHHQIMTYLIALEGKVDANWLTAKRAAFAANKQTYSIPAVPQWVNWERCGMLSAILSMSNKADEFAAMLEDNGRGDEKADPTTQRLIQMMTGKDADYDLNKVLRLVNGYFDDFEDIFYLPGLQRKLRACVRFDNRLVALHKELETRSSDSDPEQFIADAMFVNFCPSFRAALSATMRPEFDARAVDLIFALTAYRMEHGEYPETLDALVPQHLAEIPLSPFTDTSIRYFKRANMLLLSASDDYQLDGSDEALEKLIAERCENEPHSRVVYLVAYQVTAPIIIMRY